MARALLGFAPSPNDHLRDIEIARLRSRVRDQQQEIIRLESEVRALHTEAEARDVVDRHLADSPLSDAQLDEISLAGSSV